LRNYITLEFNTRVEECILSVALSPFDDYSVLTTCHYIFINRSFVGNKLRKANQTPLKEKVPSHRSDTIRNFQLKNFIKLFKAIYFENFT